MALFSNCSFNQFWCSSSVMQVEMTTGPEIICLVMIFDFLELLLVLLLKILRTVFMSFKTLMAGDNDDLSMLLLMKVELKLVVVLLKIQAIFVEFEVVMLLCLRKTNEWYSCSAEDCYLYSSCSRAGPCRGSFLYSVGMISWLALSFLRGSVLKVKNYLLVRFLRVSNSFSLVLSFFVSDPFLCCFEKDLSFFFGPLSSFLFYFCSFFYLLLFCSLYSFSFLWNHFLYWG